MHAWMAQLDDRALALHFQEAISQQMSLLLKILDRLGEGEDFGEAGRRLVWDLVNWHYLARTLSEELLNRLTLLRGQHDG